MNHEQTMWQFETRNFRVVASISPDDDCDTSFDKTGETQEKIARGEWQCFQTAVRVYFRDAEIAAEYLGGSIYAEPREFFREHIGLAAKSRADSCNYGSYFPGMVGDAIASARNVLADMPQLRKGV